MIERKIYNTILQLSKVLFKCTLRTIIYLIIVIVWKKKLKMELLLV